MKVNLEKIKETILYYPLAKGEIIPKIIIKEILDFEAELREMWKDAEKKRAPYWHETNDLFKEVLGEKE